MIERIARLVNGPSRCDDAGPGERCLLEPGHKGWHKANFYAWPNAADDEAEWAAIGRRLRSEPMPWLSRREMEYALDAARRTEAREAVSGQISGQNGPEA